MKTVDDPVEQDTPGKKKTKTKKTPPSPVAPKQVFFFKDFRKLCMKLSQENSYTQKTAIIKEFFDSFLAKGQYLALDRITTKQDSLFIINE